MDMVVAAVDSSRRPLAARAANGMVGEASVKGDNKRAGVVGGHASAELMENRALLHRVLREKQQLLARCFEQERIITAAAANEASLTAELTAMEELLVEVLHRVASEAPAPTRMTAAEPLPSPLAGATASSIRPESGPSLQCTMTLPQPQPSQVVGAHELEGEESTRDSLARALVARSLECEELAVSARFKEAALQRQLAESALRDAELTAYRRQAGRSSVSPTGACAPCSALSLAPSVHACVATVGAAPPDLYARAGAVLAFEATEPVRVVGHADLVGDASSYSPRASSLLSPASSTAGSIATITGQAELARAPQAFVPPPPPPPPPPSSLATAANRAPCLAPPVVAPSASPSTEPSCAPSHSAPAYPAPSSFTSSYVNLPNTVPAPPSSFTSSFTSSCGAFPASSSTGHPPAWRLERMRRSGSDPCMHEHRSNRPSAAPATAAVTAAELPSHPLPAAAAHVGSAMPPASSRRRAPSPIEPNHALPHAPHGPMAALPIAQPVSHIASRAAQSLVHGLGLAAQARASCAASVSSSRAPSLASSRTFTQPPSRLRSPAPTPRSTSRLASPAPSRRSSSRPASPTAAEAAAAEAAAHASSLRRDLRALGRLEREALRQSPAVRPAHASKPYTLYRPRGLDDSLNRAGEAPHAYLESAATSHATSQPGTMHTMHRPEPAVAWVGEGVATATLATAHGGAESDGLARGGCELAGLGKTTDAVESSQVVPLGTSGTAITEAAISALVNSPAISELANRPASDVENGSLLAAVARAVDAELQREWRQQVSRRETGEEEQGAPLGMAPTMVHAGAAPAVAPAPTMVHTGAAPAVAPAAAPAAAPAPPTSASAAPLGSTSRGSLGPPARVALNYARPPPSSSGTRLSLAVVCQSLPDCVLGQYPYGDIHPRRS